MNVGNVGRTLATLVVLSCVGAGCTPPVSPTPTPTPTPSVSQTPTESPEQRQERLDYEAAEKSYRAFRAEYNRVLQHGGVKEPTTLMKETAGNSYLTDVQEISEAFQGLGYRQEGEEKTVYVRPGGYSPASLVLNVCEDTRQTRSVDKTGKDLGPGELRSLELQVKFVDARWKLWSGVGRKVSSCD